jgi:hypothetical protein
MFTRIQSFLRERELRAQLVVAVVKAAAPIGLVLALLLAGAPEQSMPLVATPMPTAVQLR